MLYMLDRYIEHISKTINALMKSLPNKNKLLETRIEELFFEVPFSSKKYVEEG